jgi:hypothetical protein
LGAVAELSTSPAPIHSITPPPQTKPNLQYTDNWDGSEYKGSPFNILTLLAFLFLAVPVAGLLFAKLTYGTLWG